MMKLRVGSRDSRLAVVQAGLVMSVLGAVHPELELELVTMKTSGDRILDRTLDKIGGKGLFVRELDAALRDGRVDLTVHSCKDLPMELPEDLPIAAFTRREDPRDALVLPEGAEEPDFSRPIGTSSLRRQLQLRELYPAAEVQPVRGNVLTRLEKLEAGQYGALVLSAAGLRRLGLEGRIRRYFRTYEILPAAGQGILAVQCRKDFDTEVLRCLQDRAASACAKAERAFVGALGGGCSSPVAAHADAADGWITLTGMYVDGDSRVHKRTVSGLLEDGEDMARALARRWKEDPVCPEK